MKIVIPPNIKKSVLAINELMTAKDMNVVNDHWICYGTDTPLCGQELGEKGLIKKVEYITCPECLAKMGVK